ncbi:MAG: ABC-type nitrate/sulfonate/bicarbonate transport system, periplasmic component [Nitrosopumilales archaeon]|nr:MAG: ABC-type nitrate/sulfonate/bicarbonate transport system, periplasmic component [Nitrosopumilales archaeon]
MKLKSAVSIGIASIVAIIVATAVFNSQDPYENKIRVAYFPNVGHAVPIVGIENGIFSSGLGNKTLIETKLFDSGPQVVESLFSNSIDIAYVGPGPAINAFLKSQDNNIKILSGSASGGASFVVHPQSSIKSVDDFPGKRIAAPQIGNTQDVSLRHFLHSNGLESAEKGGSVIVYNISNPDIYTLFTKGDIDGAWVPEPWATILVNELNGTRLFFEEELWTDNQFASVLLIGKADFIEENPLIMQSWLRSHHETVNWINENPEKTTIVFNQFMKNTFGKSFSDEIISESLDNLQITADPINDSIFIFAERADSLGYLGRDGYNLNGIFYTVG